MPITRFKSFEEAENSLWHFEPDEDYYGFLYRLFEFFGKINPPAYPPGIYKYPDLNSANRQRAEWDVMIGLKKTDDYKKS
jgi:hypothetical protein